MDGPHALRGPVCPTPEESTPAMITAQRCAECGALTPTGARRCADCGAPVSREVPVAWLMGLALVAAAVLGALGYQGQPPQAPTPATASRTAAVAEPEPVTLYAPQTINVRRGPGTDHGVVGQVQRGDRRRLQGGTADWRPIVSGRFEDRYIYTPLLQAEPIPRFEIVSWDWDPKPGFAGGDGAVEWAARVRNNSDRPARQLRVEFTAFDERGEPVLRDHFYAYDLEPRGEALVKAYADFHAEVRSATVKVAR